MSNAQLALPGVLPDGSSEWVWRDDIDDGSEVRRFEHTTVMRDEVVRAMAPRPGGLYVDATFGGGGHTIALLEAEPRARVVGLDRDPLAIASAAEWLAPVADRVVLVRSAFSRLQEQLDALRIARVDGVIADLGVSSPQLEDPARGMSFRHPGPLDMRMDPDGDRTALSLLRGLNDEQLADVIFEYGDERRSRRIARSIKKALGANELHTTLDLRRAIVRAVGPARVGGIDPATRTFQALRIAVNQELEELERLLADLPHVLSPGGVVAIIAFHSLEDRLVKRTFTGPPWVAMTKKPTVPGEEERSRNARARSAKLRSARFDAPPGAP